MTQLTSKRHFLNFYGNILLIIVICGGIELLVGYTFWGRYENQTLESRDICLVPVGVIPLLMLLFTLPKFLNNTPFIILNDQKIIFNSFGRVRTYNLQDIQTLKLTGKKPFLPLKDAPMEGAQLIFTNGKKEFIFDAMYANSWQFKSRLQELVTGESVKLTNSKDHSFQIEEEQTHLYKGNQFTSMQGITLWGTIIFYATLPLMNPVNSGRGIIFLLLFILFWFFVFSWMMHYFGLSDNHLIIRNHTLPWINRCFYLPNIKEVVFEQEGKRPYSLRVITQDFKSKLYPAGTLRVKHWLSLKSELEKNNIPVRNECVPDDAYPLL